MARAATSSWNRMPRTAPAPPGEPGPAVAVTEQRRRMTCRGGKKLSRLKLGRRTGHADAQPKSGAT